MNKSLSMVFFEEYFVCTILPNESAWETLQVNGVDKLPLYFYVSGGNVRNDAFAKERFEANDAAAFGNFYDTILDTSLTFRRFDLELDPIQLLHDLVQQVKSAYFERMQAFDDDFDTVSEIPLNLCFIPGIHRDARERIRSFLAGQGFTLNGDTDYLDAFLRSLQRKAILPSRVNLAIVESSFGDLRFHYLECNEGITRRESELIVGKGVDYRVGNLARLFVEKAARRSSSRILNDTLLLEQEIKRLHRRAAAEIDKFEYDQLDLKIELSDFSSARVIIDRRELDRMSAESFQFIKFRFESFISKYSNLARTEKILLNGDLLASTEFVQFFEHTFGASKVVRPFENFIELLSRGVVAMAPESLLDASKEVEIKITVTTKVVPPGLSVPPSAQCDRPVRPPLPVRRLGVGAQVPAVPNQERRVVPPPPPVPPLTRSKDVEQADTRTASEGGPPSVKRSPLPPPKGSTRDSAEETVRPPTPAPPDRVPRPSPARVPPPPPLPPPRKT
jgi:hypothetical protein